MEKLHSDLLYIAIKFLKNKGVDSSALEAELLLSFAIGVGRERLPLFYDVKANYRTIKYFFSLLERRIAGEPIAYLTEQKEFFSHPFYVNHNVLIPRPETELIAQYIIDNLDLGASYYLDLCTGSACIVNTIGIELSVGGLIGADISNNALKIASKNAKLCGSTSVSFFKSSLFDSVPRVKYKLITCNPPYLRDRDILSLSEDIKNYEPLIALEAKEDGFFFYRELADKLKLFLLRDGLCIVEIGAGQKESVVSIFRQRGFVLKEVVMDLAGIERVLVFN